MAYVITGATGHIGNNLVRRLIQNNEDVKVLVRRIDKSIENLNIKYSVGDIFNEDFLNQNIDPDDIVIHLAGIIDIKNKLKEETNKINYIGTVTITDVCIKKKVKKYIYCSSVDCIFKDTLDEVITEPIKIEYERFIDNYPYSKGKATQYVLDIMDKYKDQNISIVYPSAVIGVNDWKPSYIGKVVKDSIDGKMQFGVKGGYNFIDVDDVVSGIINASTLNKSGSYILSGHNVSVYELYDMVNKKLNVKRKIWKIPLFIAKMAIPFVPYLSKFTFDTLQENHNYDNSHAMNELNLILTPFEETISKTVEWFKIQERK